MRLSALNFMENAPTSQRSKLTYNFCYKKNIRLIKSKKTLKILLIFAKNEFGHTEGIIEKQPLTQRLIIS